MLKGMTTHQQRFQTSRVYLQYWPEELIDDLWDNILKYLDEF